MIHFYRRFFNISAALAALLCACLYTHAQTGSAPAQRLQLDSLNGLAARALETIDVELDGAMLRMATNFVTKDDPDDKDPEDRADNARLRAALAGLQGVYVKGFEFKNPGEFTEANIAPIRAQLQGVGSWKRLAEITNRKTEAGPGNERVEVYAAVDPSNSERLSGLAVLITEPKEIMVVNVVGNIDIEALSSLAGNFNIPHLKNLKNSAPAAPASQPRPARQP